MPGHSTNGWKNFFHSSRNASPTITSARGDHSGGMAVSACRAVSSSSKLATSVTFPFAPFASVVASRSSSPVAPMSKRMPLAASASTSSTSTRT